MAEESDAPNDQNFNLVDFFSKDHISSYGWKLDEMPRDPLKLHHAQGVLGKFTWEDLGNHAYTGLYSGDSEGLIRFSEGS